MQGGKAISALLGNISAQLPNQCADSFHVPLKRGRVQRGKYLVVCHAHVGPELLNQHTGNVGVTLLGG